MPLWFICSTISPYEIICTFEISIQTQKGQVMTRSAKRIYLIKSLLQEQPQYKDMIIPENEPEQKDLLRSLFNIRRPSAVSEDFLTIQDSYLKEETAQKGITDFTSMTPIRAGIYIWRGDITTLHCDAVVNAANSQMLGCFYPCHSCIDNQIHTFSGIQLRLACDKLMRAQGHEEAVGNAKITPAFNLPCSYVIHTVGPVIHGSVTKRDEQLLASCYRSCLTAAEEHNLKSLAFCCISTGEFHFPNQRAAEIAVQTVNDYKKQTQSSIDIIFNVFKETDYRIYQNLLKADLERV